MNSDFITLNCPSCGATISKPREADRYICEYCHSEHLLRAEVQPASSIRPMVGQPANVTIEGDRKCARLVQRWYSLKYIPMAFFALAWDCFLIFWYSIAFSSNAPWIMIVFPVMHVAVGVGITYSTLAGFVNRTVLEVTHDEITVWFEPLPWLGETRIKTTELKQFFSKQKITSGKNGPTYRYELYAITRDNHLRKLLSNLDNPDVALFFEQQLESWLRIQDVPVAGELSHSEI
jgi:hypothetical protein